MPRTASEAAMRGWATRRGEMSPVERARLRDAIASVRIAAERGRGRGMRGSGAPSPTAPHARPDGSEYTRKVYTQEHEEEAAATKFARVAQLAEKMTKAEPVLREKAAAPELTREKAAATAALVMRETGMRVGGGEGVGVTGLTTTKGIAKETGEAAETFGTTTLERRHVAAEDDGSVRFNFVGKAGVEQSIVVKEPTVAASIRAFAGLPPPSDPADRTPLFTDKDGQQLGRKHVADELKQFGDFKPKDLRTLVAGEIARKEVEKITPITIATRTARGKDRSEKAIAAERVRVAKSIAKQIGTVVSRQLGNTPAVALKNYINPAIIADAYRRAGL